MYVSRWSMVHLKVARVKLLLSPNFCSEDRRAFWESMEQDTKVFTVVDPFIVVFC